MTLGCPMGYLKLYIYIKKCLKTDSFWNGHQSLVASDAPYPWNLRYICLATEINLPPPQGGWPNRRSGTYIVLLVVD